MADIVEDMRGGLPCTEAGNPCTVMDAAIGCFCAKAADEIERLRQVLENIQQARVLQGKEIVDAVNEIENLRLALEVAANDLDDWGAYTKANNARAALEGE